jgi:hypothetical protein
MTHKIIKTENYLLVVDDSEIKVGDYTFQEASNLISKYNNAYSKKIIAHLPLNNSPILEGVDLLPPLEYDVIKIAKDYLLEQGYSGFAEHSLIKNWMAEFYNKAKEKYKYTEEDLIKAIEMAQEEFWDEENYLGLEYKPKQIIQYLQQPKYPIGFKCEMQVLRERPTDIRNHIYDKTYEVPKTTTNSQGLTQWVGKYVY